MTNVSVIRAPLLYDETAKKNCVKIFAKMPIYTV